VAVEKEIFFWKKKKNDLARTNDPAYPKHTPAHAHTIFVNPHFLVSVLVFTCPPFCGHEKKEEKEYRVVI
jgi:hypothetical protein